MNRESLCGGLLTGAIVCPRGVNDRTKARLFTASQCKFESNLFPFFNCLFLTHTFLSGEKYIQQRRFHGFPELWTLIKKVGPILSIAFCVINCKYEHQKQRNYVSVEGQLHSHLNDKMYNRKMVVGLSGSTQVLLFRSTNCHQVRNLKDLQFIR